MFPHKHCRWYSWWSQDWVQGATTGGASVVSHMYGLSTSPPRPWSSGARDLSDTPTPLQLSVWTETIFGRTSLSNVKSWAARCGEEKGSKVWKKEGGGHLWVLLYVRQFSYDSCTTRSVHRPIQPRAGLAQSNEAHPRSIVRRTQVIRRVSYAQRFRPPFIGEEGSTP
jgi:hypothetical protein